MNTKITPEKSWLRIACIIVWCLCSVYLFHTHWENALRDGDYKQIGGGFWRSDEGFYSQNAANWIRTGELIVPGIFNTATHCPLLTFIQIVHFKLFGTSIFSIRALGFCVFFLTQFLFFWLWYKNRVLVPGIISLLMVMTNYTMFAYSRIGIAETFTGLYIALLTCILFIPEKMTFTSWKRNMLLALAAFGAVMMKLTLIFVPAAVALFFMLYHLLRDKPFSQRLKGAVLSNLQFGLPMVFLMGLYGLFWVKPYFTEWMIFTSTNSGRHELIPGVTVLFGGVKEFLVLTGWKHWLTLPFLLSLAGLPDLIKNLKKKKHNRLNCLSLWGWSLFIIHMLFLARNPDYRPARYYFSMIWSLSLIITVFYQHRMLALAETPSKSSFEKIGHYLPVLISIIIAWHLHKTGFYPFYFFTGLVVIVCAGVVLGKVLHRRSLKIHLPFIVLVLTSGFVFFQMFTFWKATCGFSHYEAVRSMRKFLPEDCRIIGNVSGHIALEHPCIGVWPTSHESPDTPRPEFIISDRISTDIMIMREHYPHWSKSLGNEADTSFPCLQYNIMENYYHNEPTFVCKLKWLTK